MFFARGFPQFVGLGLDPVTANTHDDPTRSNDAARARLQHGSAGRAGAPVVVGEYRWNQRDSDSVSRVGNRRQLQYKRTSDFADVRSRDIRSVVCHSEILRIETTT
jgi:hypothetical protein